MIRAVATTDLTGKIRPLWEVEIEIIKQAIAALGNRQRAAHALGISETALSLKLQKEKDHV